MLHLSSYITFTNSAGTRYLEFFGVNNLEIESTWKKLTGTCKITLPRKMKVLNGDLNDIIGRGSEVEVWLGYDGDLSLEFKGYVARVDAKVPFTVECEDEMWKLKQNRNSFTYKNASIKQIISNIYKGKTNVTDFEIGAYRIDRASSAIVLDDLQKNYNVYSYFTYDQEGVPTLNVGLGGYDFKRIAERHIYNMLVNVVENDLTYRRADDNKMRVVATSTNKGGVVIKVEAKGSDPEGEEFKLPDKRGMKESDLQKLANAELQKRKFDGYKGSITGFGVPKLMHNEIVEIQSNEYPERNGDYIADGVRINFGINGYRRIVELGIKV